MDALAKFKFIPGDKSETKAKAWVQFLNSKYFNYDSVREIRLTETAPVIFDVNNNKFCINFSDDRQNYHKKKSTIKKEIIGRALGSGRYGLNILDLSAGLAVDAIFLSQLGFNVTAIERHPLVYLALKEAEQNFQAALPIKFIYSRAQDYLNATSDEYDVIYFDPMFPEKIKSALPRQEMVFFRNLVGSDTDADEVLSLALRKSGIKRVVVKRPIKAPILFKKPNSQMTGKLIRFAIYEGAS